MTEPNAQHIPASAPRAGSAGPAPARMPALVSLGAAMVADATPDFRIDGYWMGLAKRSFAVR